jgi:hypothetical protein
MISIDAYVIEFINGNWLTMSLALGALKIVAIITPTTKDDKVHELISNLLGSLRRKPKND